MIRFYFAFFFFMLLVLFHQPVHAFKPIIFFSTLPIDRAQQPFDTAENCPTVGVAQDIMENYPVYNQAEFEGDKAVSEFALCYSIVGASLYDLSMATNPGDLDQHITSPVQLALKTKRIPGKVNKYPIDLQGGSTLASGMALKKYGSCDMRGYIDESGELVPMAQIIGKITVLYSAYFQESTSDNRYNMQHPDRDAIVDEIIYIVNNLNPSSDLSGNPLATDQYRTAREQECTSDQEVEKSLSSLATEQQRMMIFEAMRERTPLGFVGKVMDSICLGSTQDVIPEFELAFKNFGFGNLENKKEKLTEILSQGKPVGVSINNSVFKSRAVPTKLTGTGHAVTIMGQRWNSRSNTCEIIARNSGGVNCLPYNKAWPCENGSQIVSRKNILSGIDTFYIPNLD